MGATLEEWNKLMASGLMNYCISHWSKDSVTDYELTDVCFNLWEDTAVDDDNHMEKMWEAIAWGTWPSITLLNDRLH